ncbi:MAG: hypothetical protein CENE_01148 [Candidatus Celerinatantimonas neptuna]|nr:MAG: hypothetical protein CENE_01148 [Candidatus Celerinatantimonas neptuna]
MIGKNSLLSDKKGLRIKRNAHDTWLKWHRGCRYLADIPFAANRIIEGWSLGASMEIDLQKYMEIDLQKYNGAGFVILHDEILDNSTTGQGKLIDTCAEVLQTLSLKNSNGEVSNHPVLLLKALANRLAQIPCPASTTLQLDLKSTIELLNNADRQAFCHALEPIANHIILSGGDAQAVQYLADALPSAKLGYDPCEHIPFDTFKTKEDWYNFVSGTCKTMPTATMIYLNYHIILLADRQGGTSLPHSITSTNVSMLGQLTKPIPAYCHRLTD